jgi:hypothetical protein
LLCHTKIPIKFEFGSDPLILHEVMALGLRKKSRIISFTHFFFLIFIWYLVHCFAIPRYRSSLSLVLIHLFFTKNFMALGLRKKLRIISFLNFISLCLQIFIWYLVHFFAIPRYRLSLSLVLIHWFFTKLLPLDLEKNHELLVFRTFFLFAYRYSFDIWYIALPYLEFASDPLIFHEVMAFGLRKISLIISFPDFFSLCSQIFI